MDRSNKGNGHFILNIFCFQPSIKESHKSSQDSEKMLGSPYVSRNSFPQNVIRQSRICKPSIGYFITRSKLL